VSGVEEGSVDSPADRYAKLVSSGELVADEGQALAVAALDDLYQRFMAQAGASGDGSVGSSSANSNSANKSSFFSRLRDKFSEPEPTSVLQGLYMWGGVGRGKTFLMDLFVESLPPGAALRMHFHRFMREVHRSLNAHAGSSNPLLLVADEFAGKGSVLCFDEFFVSDIGDAMILAEVLAALFDRGVALVATSNVEPVNLYENGLQRSRFLPAIDLLNQHTKILNVDGGIDHRLRVLEQAEIYHVPLDDAAQESLAASFARIAATEQVEAKAVLSIEGRDMQTRSCAEGVVWFDFAALCDGPRSQNDYIELARLFHSVVLSDVPRFTTKLEDQARRFISLVDEFYDRGVKLILSAEEPVESLYQGSRLTFEFERTQSRLLEMRSHEYLAREHRA